MLINYCPLCGVGPFAYPYVNAEELRNSYDICECCGCEYGCDDTEKYYQKWVANGCAWFNPKNKPPIWEIESQQKFQIRPWPPTRTSEYLAMKVISEETWSWMLFQNSNLYYLSVVCGGIGIFTRDFELTQEEALEYENKGFSYIKSLALKVNQNPNVFEKRHLPLFEKIPGVKEATEKWRAEKKL